MFIFKHEIHDEFQARYAEVNPGQRLHSKDCVWNAASALEENHAIDNTEPMKPATLIEATMDFISGYCSCD